MLSLTENDNERSVAMHVGDRVRINLPENATTGYRWSVERLGGCVAAAGAEPHYPSGAVGAGGQAAFTFAAKKAGSCEIVLKNWREFEGDSSVQQRFRLRVTVDQ